MPPVVPAPGDTQAIAQREIDHVFTEPIDEVDDLVVRVKWEVRQVQFPSTTCRLVWHSALKSQCARPSFWKIARTLQRSGFVRCSYGAGEFPSFLRTSLQ